MKRIYFILILIFGCANSLFASESWELEKDEDGIKVYTRMTDKSDVKEFKAVTTINADKIKIGNIITNVGNYISWYPDVSKSSVLKELNKKERIIYYKIDVPWPATDRDVVLKLSVKFNKEKKEILIVMNSVIGYKKEVSNVIRIKNASGFWRLTSEGGKTKVVYQFLGEPGGDMPTWIVNMMIVDSPFNALIALKKKVE